MKVRFWQDLTTNDFASLDPARTVALLPLGSIEQHGPHLPVSTDSTIAEQMCLRAAALLEPDVPVLVMPTQAVGKSTEHLEFEGTLTHSAETLLHSWLEIGSCVARSGVRKLVFFNGHGLSIIEKQDLNFQALILCTILTGPASSPLGFWTV